MPTIVPIDNRHETTDTTSGQVFSDVPQWAKEFAAVETHEREHVRRLISTSYGLLSHAYRVQQLYAAIPRHKALVSARLQQALETHIPTDELRTLESSLAGWTVDGELPGTPKQ